MTQASKTGPGKVTLTVDGAIARITFDNVARHNAISLGMWEELDHHLRQIDKRTDLRVVVLQGAGSAAFVSGADISEFGQKRRSQTDVEHYEYVSRAALQGLRRLRHPSIAMIQGHCIGAGVAIAVSCDLRIASSAARFAIPAARIGLGYAWTELKALVDVVGPVTARELLITGRALSGEEAERRGLVNSQVPPSDLDREVKTYTDMIADNAPLTIHAAKTVVAQLTGVDAIDIDLCEKVTNACFASRDYEEGLAAFAVRRKPRFEGN